MHYPSWEDRFPKEEREFSPQLMGRVLAQSDVDLTDGTACLLELMNRRFTCREASQWLSEAQRYAIGFRCSAAWGRAS